MSDAQAFALADSLAAEIQAAFRLGRLKEAADKIRQLFELLRGFDGERIKAILAFLKDGYANLKPIWDVIAPIFGWPTLPPLPFSAQGVVTLDATVESVIQEVQDSYAEEASAQVDWSKVWELVRLIIALAGSARPA